MSSERPHRDIFASYAHLDKAIVYPELFWIKDKGFRIWYAEWYDKGIPPTSEWLAEIEKTLLNCKLFLVFITPNAIEEPMIRNEINFALDNYKLFLAIFLEPTELKYGLKQRISNLQYIEKYKLKEDHYKQKVLESLELV